MQYIMYQHLGGQGSIPKPKPVKCMNIHTKWDKQRSHTVSCQSVQEKCCYMSLSTSIWKNLFKYFGFWNYEIQTADLYI